MKWPSKPTSGLRKMTQMVPMTFHGMSSGRATRTSAVEVPQPLFRGMASAMATPSGTSISSTSPENTSWRTSASWSRELWSIARYHSVPTNIRWVGSKMSWTE